VAPEGEREGRRRLRIASAPSPRTPLLDRSTEYRSLRVSGQGRANYTIFPESLGARDLTGAEATAKELPRLGLVDALELTILIARKNPRRHPPVAARWLQLYVEENPAVTSRRLGVVACLRALGSPW
jgi:hypothetical protein